MKRGEISQAKKKKKKEEKRGRTNRDTKYDSKNKSKYINKHNILDSPICQLREQYYQNAF